MLLWDVRTGPELLAIETDRKAIHATEFSPAGDTLVAFGEDVTGKELIWEWPAHRD